MKKVRSLLSFLIIFCAFFIYFINQNNHHHLMKAENSHENQEMLEVPEGYNVPTVKALVSQGQSGTWLLELKTENFQFAPKKVGTNQTSYNEGHAHLYINGEKVNRLYGAYYNLGALSPGNHEIKVTLNSNNHGGLVYLGEIIEDTIVVNVS